MSLPKLVSSVKFPANEVNPYNSEKNLSGIPLPPRARLRHWFTHPYLSPIDRCVWFMLSAYANESSEAWPHSITLAGVLGLHPKTIEKSLKSLSSAGIIYRKKRGGSLSWTLVIDLTRWDTLPPVNVDLSSIGEPSSRSSSTTRSSKDAHQTRGAAGLPRSPSAPPEESMGSSRGAEGLHVRDRIEATAKKGREADTSSPPPSFDSQTDDKAQDLLVRHAELFGFAPVFDRQLLRGAETLLQTRTVTQVLETCRRAIAANPELRIRLAKLLAFPANLVDAEAAIAADKPLSKSRDQVEAEHAAKLARELELKREADARRLELEANPVTRALGQKFLANRARLNGGNA